MQNFIRGEIRKLSKLIEQLSQDPATIGMVESIANQCANAIKQGKKILFAGNGGSAADAQHLAAELVVRMQENRPGIPAIALTTDTSILTAAGNDFSFETIFARQVEAIGNEGDVFIGITTSGKSANILRAFQTAKEKGLITIGFTGASSHLNSICDLVLSIPSSATPKIQECHILFGHIICSLIEAALYGQHSLEQMVAVSSNL